MLKNKLFWYKNCFSAKNELIFQKKSSHHQKTANSFRLTLQKHIDIAV